jgi:hypothetical protein
MLRLTEDWWAVVLGFAWVLLVYLGVISRVPW